MSMGGSQSSGTTTSQMPPWAQQAGQRLLGAEQSQVFGGPGGTLTPFPSNLNRTYVGLQPNQQRGLNQMSAAANGPLTGLSNQANQLAMNTMGGSYLNPASNPALQSYFNAAALPMVANYETAVAPGNMAAAQQAGMFNSNAAADQRLMSQFSLGNNLQQLAANIYEPAYQFERGAQMQTQQMLPTLGQATLLPGQTNFGVGAVRQQSQQNRADTAYQNALSQFQFPYQLLSQLGGSIGQATGGQSIVTSSGPGPSGK